MRRSTFSLVGEGAERSGPKDDEGCSSLATTQAMNWERFRRSRTGVHNLAPPSSRQRGLQPAVTQQLTPCGITSSLKS